MKSATLTKFTTIGECAYQAIEKHFNKVIKWEKSVKKNEDPEALHQMRVGMRRLRTAVNGFGQSVDLPQSANDKNISKIAKILGNLRDLDVLKEILASKYQPYILPHEQSSLQTVFSHLEKQQELAFLQIQKTLKDEKYKSFKNNLQKWLAEPSYKPIASLPINQFLPDLLLPEISKFFLHPGWMFGTKIVNSEIAIINDWKPEDLEFSLHNEGEILHSLRKQAKRVRYQMELFTDIYDEEFILHISQVKQIQEILGNIQDTMVLDEWLGSIFKSEVKNQISGLTTLLAANRYQMWEEWQPLKARYLQAENQRSLRSIIIGNS